jgi:hypothetical protein
MSKRKGRFISAHSAVALPRILGYDMNYSNAPRLHSYAWNLGIRPERRLEFTSKVSSYLSLEESQALSDTYFDTVHPIFAFINHHNFSQRMKSQWTSMQNDPSFEAIICGVAALGSFFSQSSNPLESDLINQAISILDQSLSEPVVTMNMDLLTAWILRTIYHRLTTRPYIACMASSTTMHIAEVLSLQRDLTEGSVSSASDLPEFECAEIERRRRCYWIAWSLNCLLSTEYGLTHVTLPSTTCKLFSKETDTYSEHLVGLVRILESGNEKIRVPIEQLDIQKLFERIRDMPDDAAPLGLFKADICLCLLRRLLAVSCLPDPLTISIAVSVFQVAFQKLRELLVQKQPWWNMLSVPFQVICVCLSLDCHPCLALLSEAMGILKDIAGTYNTHLSREAYLTAQSLVEASRDQTSLKARIKDAALSSNSLPDTGKENGLLPSLYVTGMDDWLLPPDFYLFDSSQG